MPKTLTGTIKRLVVDKGFGFILGADGTEYFFHQSALTDPRSPTRGFDALQEQDAVTFEPTVGPKGPRAERVEFA